MLASNLQDEPDVWVHDTDCDHCESDNLINGRVINRRAFIKSRTKKNEKMGVVFL